MKINQTYRSLIDKSMASMIAAIEIYNKPDFQYREETFVTLAVNSWELLFKAHLLKLKHYRMREIYELIPNTLKNGEKSKSKKHIALNRCKNPKTIDIITAINRLSESKILPPNLKDNVEALIEYRDNAIHFFNTSLTAHKLQELCFACVRNYIEIIKLWEIPIEFNRYNLYLLPLAYIDNKKLVTGVLTNAENQYFELLSNKLEHADKEDHIFDITVSIDVDFKKHNSLEGIGVKYDVDGLSIKLTEEEIAHQFPFTYKQLCAKCKSRYIDYKCDPKFNNIMRTHIKTNEKLAHKRALYLHNPKSPIAIMYSTAALTELDKYYTQKQHHHIGI